jgi:hypothetical protein
MLTIFATVAALGLVIVVAVEVLYIAKKLKLQDVQSQSLEPMQVKEAVFVVDSYYYTATLFFLFLCN